MNVALNKHNKCSFCFQLMTAVVDAVIYIEIVCIDSITAQVCAIQGRVFVTGRWMDPTELQTKLCLSTSCFWNSVGGVNSNY